MSSGAGLRPLKHHEKKLLKKVDFLQWKGEQNVREIQVIRRYHIQDREDYARYNKLVGHISKLTEDLKSYDERDPFRIDTTEKLLKKLYDMGLIPTQKSLILCDRVTVSSFCRRRLPVVLVTNKYAQTLREAVTFVEQGQIRVGPEVVNDPAFLVTRAMEDFITWTDGSKIKKTVMDYNDELDDFDLLRE